VFDSAADQTHFQDLCLNVCNLRRDRFGKIDALGGALFLAHSGEILA